MSSVPVHHLLLRHWANLNVFYSQLHNLLLGQAIDSIYRKFLFQLLYFFSMKRSFLLSIFEKFFVLLRELIEHSLHLTHFDHKKDGFLDGSSLAVSRKTKKAVRIANTVSLIVGNKRE